MDPTFASIAMVTLILFAIFGFFVIRAELRARRRIEQRDDAMRRYYENEIRKSHGQ